MAIPGLVDLLLVLSAAVVVADGKHIAVFGGLMKSHHITVVPLIEGLLDKGHRVSFLIPNTTEHKSYFPKGVGNATMVYLGKEDWSFDTLFSGPEYDFKNLPWYRKPLLFVSVLSEYRATLEKPLFSMNEELVEWIGQPGIDAILFHAASFGCKPIVEASGIPWISFLSIPVTPFFLVQDTDEACRYPNYMKPPPVGELKSSLMARVKNHMICRFLQGYMIFANHEIGALFENKGLKYSGDFMGELMDAPQMMLLGGPPLSVKVELGDQMHVLGTVDKPKPHPIPSDMLEWLDAASADGAPVMYVSMGTKYELHEATCTQLVALLGEIAKTLGVRFLWSLRLSQQEKLRTFLPTEGAGMRIEQFTPQPEVLQHPAVRVFLSHCGWGGVSDTISAGVPVLGYPGMQDQFINAMMLEEAGAGIVLKEDFSNLLEGAKLLLENPSFASASKAAGETLRSYGGLPRALEIMEAAADGTYLKPLAEQHARMSEVDPFFRVPQVTEQWISLGIYLALVACPLLLLGCCCRCCCGRRAKPTSVEHVKKQQ